MVELFHDQSKEYISPLYPKSFDNVNITVRIKSNEKINGVFLQYSLQILNNDEQNYLTQEMKLTKVSGVYSFYNTTLKVQDKNVRYNFVVKAEKEYLFLITGASDEPNKNLDYIIAPNFNTPEWSKGALWYQIMPDSFYNGNIFNDKYTTGYTKENAWGNSHFCGEDYFGGDLEGVIEKLDYIKSFGVDAISLNPIWVATHQAGYGSDDLTEVDSCFGSDDALIELRKATKEKGLKLCLDGVFDYIINKSKYLNEEGIYPLKFDKNNPYYSMFLHDLSGKNVSSFWGHPLMDFSSEEYRDFVYKNEKSIVKTYLKPPYDIDAWRMDVGNIYEGSNPVDFGSAVDVIADMNKEIKSVGKEKLLITENDIPKMRGYSSVDSKWNYEIGVPLRNFIAGNIKASELKRNIDEFTKVLPRAMANSCFNHITTHDTQRITDTANYNENAVISATVFNMTFVGAPSIYFGDEYGEVAHCYPCMGKAAPTSFGSMNWNEAQKDSKIKNIYSLIGNYRKQNVDFFKDAGYEILTVDDKKNILAFVRFKDEKLVLTVLNTTNKEYLLKLDLSAYTRNDRFIDMLSNNVYDVKDGMVEINVLAGGCLLTQDKIANVIDEYTVENIVKTNNGYLLIDGEIKRNLANYYKFDVEAEGDITVEYLGEKYKVDKKLSIKRTDKVVIKNNGKTINDSREFYETQNEVIIKGNGKVKLKFAQLPLIKEIDFSKYNGGFFSQHGIKIKDGKAVLKNERQTAFIGYEDYAVYTMPNGNGGLIICQDNQSVKFGMLNGKYFVKLNDVEVFNQEIKTEKIFLEKIGTRVNAGYVSNGERKYAVKNISANFSYGQVGIFADGKCAFEYFNVGVNNKIRDFETVDNSIDLGKYVKNTEIVKYQAIGEFEYKYAGISHIGKDYGKLALSGVFEDFKLIFTLKDIENWLVLNISSIKISFRDENITIAYDNEKYSKNISANNGKFVVAVIGERLIVLKDGKEIFNICYNVKETEIYFDGYGSYTLCNVGVYRGKNDIFVARAKIAPMKEGLDISSEWMNYAYIYYNKPIRDFCFGANIKFNTSASVDDGYFAINYGVKSGACPEKQGVTLRIHKKQGKIELVYNEKVVAENYVKYFDNESFYLVLMRIGEKVKVYIAPNELSKECNLIFDEKVKFRDGGCVIFVDNNARSFICNDKIINLKTFDDANELLKNIIIAPSKHRYMI